MAQIDMSALEAAMEEARRVARAQAEIMSLEPFKTESEMMGKVEKDKSEVIAEARRWMGRLPRADFEKLLVLTRDAVASEERKTKALHESWQSAEEECVQILAQMLDFPWFIDDQENFPGATEKDGVCVGPYISIDLAEMLAQRYAQALRVIEQYTGLDPEDARALVYGWVNNDDPPLERPQLMVYNKEGGAD